MSMTIETRHIGNISALCDGRKRASLREDLGVDRYKKLGVKERFTGQKPYRICLRCIKRVGDYKFMMKRYRSSRSNP